MYFMKLICLAFQDINPAPTHFLVIPPKIVSLADLSDEDEAIVGRYVLVASQVASLKVW